MTKNDNWYTKLFNYKISNIYDTWIDFYQAFNENNDYLTLFYLKDGIANNLVNAMRNLSNGTPSDYVFTDVFGEITMQLTKSYSECPLKVDPIK